MGHLHEDVGEPCGQCHIEKMFPRDVGHRVVLSREVHSQHLTEEEESEDRCPDSSVEEDCGDGPEVLALGVPEAVGSQADEGYRVREVSHHESEEHGEEDADHERRVDLLVFGRGDQRNGVFVVFRVDAVVVFRRRGLEAGFGCFLLVEVPSPLLFLDVDVDAVTELRRQSVLELGEVRLGHPCVDDVGVIGRRDPERGLPLPDPVGQEVVGCGDE